jgi:hypothetical protein
MAIRRAEAQYKVTGRVFSDTTDATDSDHRSLRKSIKLHRQEWSIRRDDHNDGACSAAGVVRLRCSANLVLPWEWVVLRREWATRSAKWLPLHREPMASTVIRLHEHANGVSAKFCGESAT